jgi:hypothetical protein
LILLLLTLIVFSGFPTETFRLLADYTTAPGVFAPAPALLGEKLPAVLYPVWGPQWGFVGYIPAVVLGHLPVGEVGWEIMHNVFFWLHFLIVLSLLYLLPFSRFFHIVMGPIVVAFNTTMAREAHGSESKKGHALPEAAAVRGGQS